MNLILSILHKREFFNTLKMLKRQCHKTVGQRIHTDPDPTSIIQIRIHGSGSASLKSNYMLSIGIRIKKPSFNIHILLLPSAQKHSLQAGLVAAVPLHKIQKHASQAGLVAAIPLHKIQKHALQAGLVAAIPLHKIQKTCSTGWSSGICSFAQNTKTCSTG